MSENYQNFYHVSSVIMAFIIVGLSIALDVTLDKLDRCERLQTSAMTGP